MYNKLKYHEQELMREFNTGVTIKRIAENLSVSKVTLYRWLKKRGLMASLRVPKEKVNIPCFTCQLRNCINCERYKEFEQKRKEMKTNDLENKKR